MQLARQFAEKLGQTPSKVGTFRKRFRATLTNGGAKRETRTYSYWVEDRFRFVSNHTPLLALLNRMLCDFSRNMVEDVGL